MSEAKKLHEQNNKDGPEVYSESQPVIKELQAEALPVSAPPTALAKHEFSEKKRSTFSTFAESFASFLLKFTIVSAAAFAMGAFLTINILMDRIDHKSGWLKEFLQFIRETSKILLK